MTTQARAATDEGRELLQRDELGEPGYVPGYRKHARLGMSPFAPRVGGVGMLPGYHAPTPPDAWSFTFSGYMTASLQFSVDEREVVGPGQHRTVYHSPPQTVDTYAHFTSTTTVPGNWVSLRFAYGNPRISANVSIDTWNPTRPTTYYQIGTQYFINNAYLALATDPLGDLRLRFEIGRIGLAYGNLGRWGGGIYVNPITAKLNGTGERVLAELDLGKSVVLLAEHGLMGDRDGKIPDDITPGATYSWRRPLWPASYVHHAHLGARIKGTTEVTLQAHYVTNWSQEDRTALPEDNPGTRQLDEANLRDGRLTVYGFDARASHDAFGYLAGGIAWVVGKDSYPLRSMETYGGLGEEITDRYWGVTSGGTGKLLVTAINYGLSVGKLINYPGTFSGNGPDVQIAAGFHAVKTWTDFEPYDGRWRYKYGADVLYAFLRHVGAGIRGDRVVPNSRVPGETFHVLAPRLVFKSDWQSRESVQLLYAKWFYGERTRNEGTGERTPERLDDEMFALNFNMYW